MTRSRKRQEKQKSGVGRDRLILCAIYYAALAFIKIPYITIGILSFAYTFSTFEVVTVVFLIAMMIFMGVRKIPVLVFVRSEPPCS